MKVGARILEASAMDCLEYLGEMAGRVRLVLTSPPYLNRQTYTKDSWLRLWFLDRDRIEIGSRSLETGSVPVFVEAMKTSLAKILASVTPGGVLALVCGEAHVDIGRGTRVARISDLCLYALSQSEEFAGQYTVETIVHDRKLMRRGSYFAVHGGNADDGSGVQKRRFGEEEILVIRRSLSSRDAACKCGKTDRRIRGQRELPG
jgi:hypothetical protein